MSNLYLVTRTDPAGWDQYIEFVICARDEDEAMSYHPSGILIKEKKKSILDDWPTDPKKIKARLIGSSLGIVDRGEVFSASFNAG